MLLRKFTALFVQEDRVARGTGNRALELASAALMFEVARADFTIDNIERGRVTALLADQFNLNPEEAATVTEVAAEAADAATCIFEFTRTLNEHATFEQKRELLVMMWRVAIADNVLDHYEEHVIRKVADLLYVPHSDFIGAKHEALKSSDI